MNVQGFGLSVALSRYALVLPHLVLIEVQETSEAVEAAHKRENSVGKCSDYCCNRPDGSGSCHDLQG